MKKMFFQLLLVLSIAFSPVGQAMVVEVMDQIDMSTMMNDCMNCDQHQGMTQNSCVEGSCLTDICLNTAVSSVYFFLDSISSVVQLDLSMTIEERYGPHYLSQIALPLYRPPIA